MWCGGTGDVWCAVLLPEHFHVGTDNSPSVKGARQQPFAGKLAPIDVPAKANTGGTLPAFGVLRGLQYELDYVFGCRDPGSGELKAVSEQRELDAAWRKKDPGRTDYPWFRGVVGDNCGVASRGTGSGLAVVLTARGWAKLLRPEQGGLGAAAVLGLPATEPRLLYLHETSVLDDLKRQETQAKQRVAAHAMSTELKVRGALARAGSATVSRDSLLC